MTPPELGARLALLNAFLNGTSGVLLLIGWIAIKSGSRRAHAWMMVSAFCVSAAFLVSYLTRVYVSGTHYYPGSGTWKMIYLAVLGTHMIAAVATPPLAIRTLFLAWKRRFAEHKRLNRWTLPVWMYTSATGVLVYRLLYHPPG
jgi:putative membrane protein